MSTALKTVCTLALMGGVSVAFAPADAAVVKNTATGKTVVNTAKPAVAVTSTGTQVHHHHIQGILEHVHHHGKNETTITVRIHMNNGKNQVGTGGHHDEKFTVTANTKIVGGQLHHGEHVTVMAHGHHAQEVVIHHHKKK